MDRRQSEQIARLLKERRFTKGETVIMEGSGGAAFFIIASGEAKVSSKGVNLATLGPGEHFGEVALIDGGPRSATVTAATDLVCYGLTFWEFRPLVERNGTIGWRLLQALAKQLRDAVARDRHHGGLGGAAFFIIASGEAMVSSKGINRATLGPGQYFGEVALIDGGPRSATVTAATDLVCYGLTFWEFRPLVERNGTIGWRLLQALAKQLRDAVSAGEKTP